MGNHKPYTFFFLVLFLFSSLFAVLGRNQIPHEDDGVQLQTYIVHVQQPENANLADSQEDLKNWYQSFLASTTTDLGEPRMVYSYGTATSGFAARLSEQEIKSIEKKDGFLHAYPDRLLPLLTTHTPDFLGLQLGKELWSNSDLGKGVIIGVLDTGIFASHPSFDDEGMPPPPSKWKGTCELGNPRCNNKLIGARDFHNGVNTMQGLARNGASVTMTPTDEIGHGTHTASTAAGSFVKNANVLGNANGTASGVAPRAHLAIYKVCSLMGCSTADILAGMDAAIQDGVNVLSLSLGGSSTPFYGDPIALGAFSAFQKGIFVSCAAGNDGPGNATLSNEAPWILTVAASTMDRIIRATVKLGDGKEFDGESLYQPHDFPSKLLPLIYPGDKYHGDPYCRYFVDSINITGKVVLCVVGGGVGRIDKGVAVKKAGGAAMILMNQVVGGHTTLADAHVLPASHVSYSAASMIMDYLNSTKKPTATIAFKGTLIGTSPAPTVAYFSSRGPSTTSPGILKPDITGPGVNVLAAWPFKVGPPSAAALTNATFDVIAGTSMSTPHLSGIAALIKSAHPDWSPSAIKSAIMTTSNLLDHDGKPIMDERLQPASFFAIGAGHVSPLKASDPGLVYDLDADDYIPYLCGLGYSDEQVGVIVHRKISCSKVTSIREAELNYPSILVSLSSGPVTVNRIVTNVGEANSAYTVEVDAPEGVSVTVKPEKLQFSKVNEKKSFTVTFSASRGKGVGNILQGNLNWVSEKHLVRSPISISF